MYLIYTKPELEIHSILHYPITSIKTYMPCLSKIKPPCFSSYPEYPEIKVHVKNLLATDIGSNRYKLLTSLIAKYNYFSYINSTNYYPTTILLFVGSILNLCDK